MSCWRRTLAQHLLPPNTRSDTIWQGRSTKTKLEKLPLRVCWLPRECAIWAPRPQDDEELKERIGSYGEQVDMQQSVCESRQAIAEGDRLLAQQLEASYIYTCVCFCMRAVDGLRSQRQGDRKHAALSEYREYVLGLSVDVSKRRGHDTRT